MPDLLVKLYELPPLRGACEAAGAEGVTIRRVLVPERSLVVDWVATEFTSGWANECRVATSRHPVSCFVAIADSSPVGFCCYNATFMGFFGPIGVGESHRGRGLGTALTLASLHALKNEGFAYAVIGAAGSPDYFARIAGATVIDDSSPGPYRGMLN